MFQNKRYIIRGVQVEIPFVLQLLMWECVDRMSEPEDDFQVFRLENSGGLQKIIHFSEQSKYCKEYMIPTDNPITAKVYIIDSDEYSTMLLASESNTLHISTSSELLIGTAKSSSSAR